MSAFLLGWVLPFGMAGAAVALAYVHERLMRRG